MFIQNIDNFDPAEESRYFNRCQRLKSSPLFTENESSANSLQPVWQ
jgi:hypothetical protein